MAQNANRIYIYMNNHVGGQGLANAIELKSILTGQKPASPKQLMLKFPVLKNVAVPLDDTTVPLNSRPKKKKDAPPENLLF
jgi:hypothetical protein